VNDDGTKRAVESPDDAYRVFRTMLETGNPPGDWEQHLAQVEAAAQRLQGLSSSGLHKVQLGK
jgi:toxin YhaV